MPFELVRTAEEFFAAPEGRVLTRPHFAYIGASDTLLSLVIWGHVADRDVDELIATLTVGAQKPKRRDALLQMQAISAIDEASLRTLARFMESTVDRSHAATKREAIVRPSGTIGMTIAGFYGVVPARYPTAIFAARDDAFAWLEVPDPQCTEIASESDRLISEAAATPDVLYRLRELLADKPALGELEAIAKLLETTERTLQRRLQDAGSSFEKELAMARVAAAKTLLLRTSLAIKAVAHEVGLPSASRLSQLFALHEGMTPTEFRTKAR